MANAGAHRSTSEGSGNTREELEHTCESFLRLLDPKIFRTIENLALVGTDTRISSERASHRDTTQKLLDEEEAHRETKEELEHEISRHSITTQALTKEKGAYEKAKKDLSAENARHITTKQALIKEEEAHKKTKKELNDEKSRNRVTEASIAEEFRKEKTRHDETQVEKAQLQSSLEESRNAAQQEKFRLEKELADMRTRYEEAKQQRVLLEADLQKEKEKLKIANESLAAISNATPTQSTTLTDTINSLLMGNGNGRFNDGYPHGSENGRTELDENYVLTMSGNVEEKPKGRTRPPQVGLKEQSRPKEEPKKGSWGFR